MVAPYNPPPLPWGMELETRAVLNCYPDRIIHQIDSTQEPMLVLLEILKVIARLPKPAVSDGSTVFSRPSTPS